MKGNSGFTFIELVVVLVLMSVLMSVASPQLSSFYKRVKVESGARQLKYFLEYAGEVALSEKKTCRIRVEPGWRKLLLHTREETGKAEEFRKVETGPHSWAVMPDMEIDAIEEDGRGITPGTDYHIDISPLYSAHEVLFSLKDSAGNSAKIRIGAGSAKVVILD